MGFQNRSAASRLLLSERLEAELLAANTRLEHEAPFPVVKTATPFWYLALADAPLVAATALA